MNVLREDVMVKLFAHLSASYNWNIKSRKFLLWDQVPPEQRPCLLMLDGNEKGTGGNRNLPPITTIDVKLVIYANTLNAEAPSSVLNPILDAVDFALQPDNPISGQFTLGGIVNHIWREGETLKINGDDDGDGMLVIPIHILSS